MSAKERVRLDALHRVKRGEITVAEAGELMKVCPRQAKRLWKSFKARGDRGLVHGLRGRPSNRRMPQDLCDKIIKRHQEKYADFGPTFACEKLVQDGLVCSPDTLVALLKERGLWQRQRRRGRHRKRRERRASFGSLIQMDGSHHKWFEERAPGGVLMVLIDDATNCTYAQLYSAETLPAAFDVFGRWAKRHGLPRSLYVDRHSIYRDEDHPEKPTQFGRAARDLQVELILARSPQAKGRVERRNALFQDRLVKELRLRGISDIDQANGFLEKVFLPELNRKYAVDPRDKEDLHRVLPPDLALDEILCVQEQRVVGKDWCIRWNNQFLQIPAEHAALDLPGKKVLVRELSGGKLLVTYKETRLNHRATTARPQAPRERPAAFNNKPWKPGANHPWNRDPVGRAGRRGPAPAPVLAPAAPALGPAPPPARVAGNPATSGHCKR